MSGLSALKFVASKPQQGNSPKHARRQKLSNKLHEQIQMAKAVQSGTEFVPVKTPMAISNSPTCGHPKFPQARHLDYDDSCVAIMRAAASFSL